MTPTLSASDSLTTEHAIPESDCHRLALLAADGHSIPVYHWHDNATSATGRGIIHICHGMAEHAQRYHHLARVLNSQGFMVVAHDHRGHGPQTPDEKLGQYASDNGWALVTSDVGVVQGWIESEYPNLPCYLLGHSMGSFIAQGYLQSHPTPSRLAGLILSGSNRDTRLKLFALRAIVAAVCRLQGADRPSRLIHALTFGAFAKSVPDATTPFDWLSTDENAVRDYINDRWCGFDCTSRLWADLGGGLAALRRAGALRKIPSQLPILILSGDRDPVGEFGRGPQRLARAYRDSGHSDVSCVVLQGMRHEPFNEAKHQEAEETLLSWLARHGKAPHNSYSESHAVPQ